MDILPGNAKRPGVNPTSSERLGRLCQYIRGQRLQALEQSAFMAERLLAPILCFDTSLRF